MHLDRGQGATCYLCKCEAKSVDFELPMFVFTWLEGKPAVCEQCVARAFGVEASWLPIVEENLKEKEI